MPKPLAVLAALLLFQSALTIEAAELREGVDYLTNELRARVEKLKSDVRESATNATNQTERARVLWDWMNAFALDGGDLPVNLTAILARALVYPERLLGRESTLDGYVEELSLHDEQPDAIGKLQADLGPFAAMSYVTLKQVYTVGSKSIQTGGGFLIARHFMPNYGRWQSTSPQEDNYISITSSNSEVSFSADTVPVQGMHGGFRGSIDTLVFRLASGTLSADDRVTVTYGDTSAGSRGFLMPSFSSDRMPLPVYLAFVAGGHFYTLPIQPVVVTGAGVAGVHGFAPSIVATNEPFTLSVRAEDENYNRATGALPAWKILINGEPFRDIAADGKPITLLREIKLNEPGVYHFTIESTDGSIKGDTNPVLVEDSPGHRIYWGDTHGHSGFAEGVGTPERFMTWARDDARLDYVTHSEHDIWMDDYEWEVLRNNVREYTEEGEFIAYLGYEWTVNNLHGGHHNVLFRTPERRDRIPVQFYPTLSKLYAGLRASSDTADVVVIPHAHQAGDYRQNDPELEPLVEIMSQHGNFEWFGRMYLNHGHQVGFTAASDNHLSQPGYTAPMGGSLSQRGGLGALLANEKTTDALFDAMKSLRAYATTGDRIIMKMSVNGTVMGQRAPFATERLITGRVIGTAAIDTITLIKNDEEIWQQDYYKNENDKIVSEDSFLLSFASDSKPLHPGDNPRGWRNWRGTIEIANAKLLNATGQDFHNRFFQSLAIDKDDPNLLHFATQSRGDTSSILLKLSGIRRNTELHIKLESSRETGGAPPLYRRPQNIDAALVKLRVRDLENGRTTQHLQVDAYTDRIVLRRVVTKGERDISFEFTDSSDREGDYYYLRVRQANDAQAWSSPVWVGGYPKL